MAISKERMIENNLNNLFKFLEKKLKDRYEFIYKINFIIDYDVYSCQKELRFRISLIHKNENIYYNYFINDYFLNLKEIDLCLYEIFLIAEKNLMIVLDEQVRDYEIYKNYNHLKDTLPVKQEVVKKKINKI